MKPIQEFYPLLQEPKKIVITMHQKPDGDAMGSALGLYHFLVQLNHQVTVISPTNWAGFLNWMPGIHEVVDFEKYNQKCSAILAETEVLFCLDFNIMYRTKHLEKELLPLNCIKVLIDHHQQPAIDQFTFGFSNTAKSSTCEMVYDFIVEAGYDHLINEPIAACLYTGVMTDTGSFRFPLAGPSVHRMIARLQETGMQHTYVHEQIYDNFLENRLRFIGHALLNRLEILYEYNTAFMAISKQDLKKYDIKTGDTEGLVNYLLSVQGIKFGALVIDRDEERKWSFRSKGNFDVNAFARSHFEGGGHFNAAGGRSSDDLQITTEKFKKVLKQYEKDLQ